MKLDLDLDLHRYPRAKGRLKLRRVATRVKDLYRTPAQYAALQAEFRDEINALQQMMFAHDRYGVLLIFQAMDAAGKDGTIQHVMSGINPQGVEIHGFKRPSDEELDHDYLWRTSSKLPPRGRIGIFNRSYYEEVLTCKVHPEIVRDVQRLPSATTTDLDKLFRKRYDDIGNLEAYAHRNGIRIVKFMLHVSQGEQRRRFLDRIDTPAKNWKFNVGDVAERARWQDYMHAYEDAINATATDACPWYVVPADDKPNMRLIVSAAILYELKKLDLSWPTLSKTQLADLAKAKLDLLAEQN
ncbi:MAG: polyphosphate kinase 2 family protein [Gammaproteobacteria bacterium]|nr:polyphosphate kinase 2 family protein [Gammaproteobacteria bacterium]